MVCDTCSQEMNTEARFCCHCGKPFEQRTAWAPSAERLMRRRNGRMVAGVCAGIAEAYGFDPALVRILTVAIFFCGFGTVALAYLAAWIIMPNAPLYAVPVSPIPPTQGFAGSSPIS